MNEQKPCYQSLVLSQNYLVINQIINNDCSDVDIDYVDPVCPLVIDSRIATLSCIYSTFFLFC